MKRKIRTNNHIEIKVEGEIKAKIFSSIDGGFNRIIIETFDNKALLLDFPNHEGLALHSVVKINDHVKATITGDSLLLRKILVKHPFMRDLEKEYDLKLTGMGNLKAITTKRGEHIINPFIPTRDKYSAETKFEIIPNAIVISTEKKKKSKLQLFLNNGDTLNTLSSSPLSSFYKNDTVTYVKPVGYLVKGGYYPEKNTYQMSSGILLKEAFGIAYRITTMGRVGVFLSVTKGKFLKPTVDLKGIVNGAVFVMENGDSTTFEFDQKNGRLFDNYVKTSNEDFILYYSRVTSSGYKKDPKVNILYGLKRESDSAILTLDKTQLFFGSKNQYIKPQKTLEGNISYIYYGSKKKDSFRSIMIDDQNYVKISTIMAINMQDIIQVGAKVSIRGWERKIIEEEVKIGDIKTFIISSITVDGKTFTSVVKNIDNRRE